MAVLTMAVGVDANNVLFSEEIDGGRRTCSRYPCLNLVSSDVGIPLFLESSRETVRKKDLARWWEGIECSDKWR